MKIIIPSKILSAMTACVLFTGLLPNPATAQTADSQSTWLDSDTANRLELARLSAPAPEAPQAAQPTNAPDVVSEVNALIGTMPESSSWSNTTLKIDVGYAGLGIGQTGTAEAYLRGTYNLTANLGAGIEGDFGAGNAIDGALVLGELRKDLNDWAELYGVAGGGYSFSLKTPEYLAGFGTRVIPLGAIPQLAVDTEIDLLGTPALEGASAPHTRLLAGVTYHF